MRIDTKEIIKFMKRCDDKVVTLCPGWNLKQIDNFREYEIFNDAENQIYLCNDDNLQSMVDMLTNDKQV